MKVKYVGESCVSFEHGEIYEVTGTEKMLGETFWKVIDESNEDYLYSPELFEVVEE